VARVSDDTLSELRSELFQFKHATFGSRDYAANMLAGAVEEVIDEAQWDDEPVTLAAPANAAHVAHHRDRLVPNRAERQTSE
jgi:hypothetical protein